MKAFTWKELQPTFAGGCSCCKDGQHNQPLFLHSKCHISSPVEAFIENGELQVNCYECKKPILRVKIDSGEQRFAEIQIQQN